MASTTTSLRVRMDENDADKMKVKKFGITTTEQTKRAALGDLQNRGALLRALSEKDGKAIVSKDLNDIKLQNALRNAKARVDTHWKKAPTVNGKSMLTRSNSMRTAISTTSNTAAAAGTVTNGISLPKTLTTKMVENKVQQVKVITRVTEKTKLVTTTTTTTAVTAAAAGAETKLRREDSNLSRKSLNKLKAALSSKPIVGKTNSASAVLQLKKEKEEQKLQKHNSEKSTKVVIKKTTTTTSAAAAATTKTKTAAQCDFKIVSVQSVSAELLNAVEDIDADDSDNLMLVSEYANDIYNYLYSIEVEQPVYVDHLAEQVEVSHKMRAVLIDWINEVHLQFRLTAESFQMGVALIDRYLQVVKDVKRSHLQLVGVTALFIAAKYEELFPPSIADFVYITDDTYTVKQILQMELKILKALDCNLSRPLPIHFLRRFSKAAKVEDCHHTMSKYFLELAAIDYDLASYKPSEIAAASLLLSLHLLNDNAKIASSFNDKHWTPTLQWYSRYTADYLRPITQKIATIARDAPNVKLKAVYTKYLSSKFQKISQRSELYGALMDSIISSNKK